MAFDIKDREVRRDMKHRRLQDMNAELNSYKLSLTFVQETLQMFFHIGEYQVYEILKKDPLDVPNPFRKYDERWVRDYVADIRKREKQKREKEERESNKNQKKLF